MAQDKLMCNRERNGLFTVMKLKQEGVKWQTCLQNGCTGDRVN